MFVNGQMDVALLVVDLLGFFVAHQQDGSAEQENGRSPSNAVSLNQPFSLNFVNRFFENGAIYSNIVANQFRKEQKQKFDCCC